MKKKFLIVFSVLVAAFAVLLVFYFYKMKTRNIIDKLSEGNRLINILVAASNVYNDNKHRLYLIVSINPDNSNIGLTFIPPNFKIITNSSGDEFQRLDKIEFDEFKLIKESLSRQLKLQIPFYVELYSPDVQRCVDLTEGIDLFIVEQVKNIKNSAFGLNYFDGSKIIKYINSSENNSIYQKYDRIQDLILTFYQTRERYKRFQNILFLAEVFKSIKTNLLPQELYSLSDLFFNEGKIYTTIVPGKFSDDGYYYIDDVTYKIYENDFVKRLVLKEDSETSIKVKILNGTTVPGLARRMRNILMRDGLSVVEFGTSPYPNQEKTVIINQKGNFDNVMKVSELLGITQIHHIIDSSQLHSVLIIIGKDMIK